MVRKNSEANIPGTGGKKDDTKVRWPNNQHQKLYLTYW